MSAQKYKRTNFEEDDNSSLADVTPTGVTYDPAIAFKAGATFCQRRSALERVLLFIVIVLSLLVVILAAILGAHQHIPSGSPAPSSVPATNRPGWIQFKFVNATRQRLMLFDIHIMSLALL